MKPPSSKEPSTPSLEGSSEALQAQPKKRYLRTVNNIHVDANQARRQLLPITFTDQDIVGLDLEQNSHLVITIEVANFAIKKVLIDQGNSANILYMSTFRRLQILEIKMCSYHEQLVGFSRECVDTHGYIDLLTTFDDSSVLRMISICYLKMATDTSYNILINRLMLNSLDAIVSTPHLAMKFPSSNGQVVIIKAD
ncbi:hypothetical protein CR513_44873, partial [Mucuna pruriens]